MQLVQRAPIHQQMMFTSQMHHVQMQTQLVIYVWVTKEDPPITQFPLQPMLPVALNHTEQLQQLKKDWRFHLYRYVGRVQHHQNTVSMPSKLC